MKGFDVQPFHPQKVFAMSVAIRISQRKVKFDKYRLEQQTLRILELCGCKGWDLGLWLAGDKTIRSLNEQYRRKKKTTDILSFPFHEDITTPGVLPDLKSEGFPGAQNLGDIVIGVPHVSRDCIRYGWDLHHRVPVLITHGVCHLMGYDHVDDESFEEMYRREMSVLKGLEEDGIVNIDLGGGRLSEEG